MAKGKAKSHQTKKIAPALFITTIPAFLASFTWAEGVLPIPNENGNRHSVTIESKYKLDERRSVIRALSADGKIARGTAENSNNDNRAIFWSGENWQTKTDLASLKADSGDYIIPVLSTNGKIARGRAYNDNNEYKDAIWSGENWQTKTELGSLKADNSGNTTISVLSADGKIVAGRSDIDSVEYTNWRRAIIWSGNNWQTKTDLGTLRKNKGLK